MSGIVWHILVFGVIGIFLIVIIYRTLAIIRLPVHLRWELAPIPHEKGKGRYGGSYLEEYEWWNKPQHRSRIAPIVYMAKEIFLLRGVWEHNRALWPLSFAFHMGIYLIVVMLLLSVVNAVFIIAEVPLYVLNVSRGIASVLALMGYLLGSLGAIGLIIKRALDSNLRPFNTITKYFNLVFLGAVFGSGAYAWFSSPDFASEMSLFIKGLITLDAGITLTLSLSLHVVISLLFILYLPWTDMIHFIAKYFAYHEIRWNDAPQDEKMKRELRGLLAQPVSWSAAHVGANGKKNWVDITTKKTSDEKEA
ncbi:MAG: respiratory nitrate reductase subunit gamma [Chloroflexi bacterium]|nr:respiratory nitrate reductase subunit gamma [Chloroflexota bacterium]MBL7062160.1 respiratory nitrate reductase subunit gamma [Dehalococcoidia bacterium]